MSEGTGGWGGWSGADTDARLAADPGTTGAELARIAAARPDLHAALAANPASYPALLDWLAALHDPAVDAALRARWSAGAGPSIPSPTYGTAAPAASSAPYGQGFGQPTTTVWYGEGQPTTGASYGEGQPTTGGWYGQATTDTSVPVIIGAAPPRRRARVWIAVGVAAALVLGVGGAGYAFVSAKLAGSATPEAAVSKLLNGIAKKDVLALAGSMSPAELSPFRAAAGNLNKGVKATGDPKVQAAVLKAFDSVTIKVDGLKTQSATLDKGLAKVTILSGTVTVDGDPAVIADGIATAMGASGQALLATDVAAMRTQISDELSKKLPYTLNLADNLAFRGDGPFLVTVQEKGKWYVSPLMTLGEYLAESQGVTRGAMPAPGDVVKPKDPVDAAKKFAAAVEKVPGGDLSALAAALPLAERRFVAVYGQAFMDEANKQDPQGGGTLAMTSTDFQVVNQNGDSAEVAPTNLAFDVTDSAGTASSISTDGQCITVKDQSGSNHACTSDFPLLGSLGLDQLRLTTVKEDGGWYVSIFGTVGTWSATVETKFAQLSKDGKLQDQTWWQSQLPSGAFCAMLGTC